jgi:hypothetical protein
MAPNTSGPRPRAANRKEYETEQEKINAPLRYDFLLAKIEEGVGRNLIMHIKLPEKMRIDEVHKDPTKNISAIVGEERSVLIVKTENGIRLSGIHPNPDILEPTYVCDITPNGEMTGNMPGIYLRLLHFKTVQIERGDFSKPLIVLDKKTGYENAMISFSFRK